MNLNVDDTYESFYDDNNFVDFEEEKAEDVLKYLKNTNN